MTAAFHLGEPLSARGPRAPLAAFATPKRRRHSHVAAVLLLSVCGSCAPALRPAAPASVPRASDPSLLCIHGVPCETCVRCHSELAVQFKVAGDWCAEHGVPESQCGICNPRVVAPPPSPPAGADIRRLVESGEDLASLDPFVVHEKATLFDFYADWCGPCRRVDEHVFDLLKTRRDIAYRKINIGSWETPIAKHYLAGVPTLPFVVVYGRDGHLAGRMAGLDLGALDRAISAGTGR